MAERQTRCLQAAVRAILWGFKSPLLHHVVMKDLLTIAEHIAKRAHKNQIDKGGRAYIEHPLFVASQVDGINAKAAALLHDVLEDSDITPSDLLNQGIPQDIVDVVVVLTRKANESYEDYIKRVKKNPIACQVKIADLKHNSDLTRLKVVTMKDRMRVEKYQRALQYLKGNDE